MRWVVEPGDRWRSHALARELIADELDMQATKVRLVHSCPRCASSQHGPLVAVARTSRERLPINVSVSRTMAGEHSWAAAVIASSPVGIDIQSIAPFEGDSGLARVLRHPDELASNATTDHSSLTTAQLWTRKEAVLKAYEVGLQLDPRELCFAPDAPRLVKAPEPIRPTDVEVTDLAVGPTSATLVGSVALRRVSP